jgi:hypothetical protein
MGILAMLFSKQSWSQRRFARKLRNHKSTSGAILVQGPTTQLKVGALLERVAAGPFGLPEVGRIQGTLSRFLLDPTAQQKLVDVLATPTQSDEGTFTLNTKGKAGGGIELPIDVGPCHAELKLAGGFEYCHSLEVVGMTFTAVELGELRGALAGVQLKKAMLGELKHFTVVAGIYTAKSFKMNVKESWNAELKAELVAKAKIAVDQSCKVQVTIGGDGENVINVSNPNGEPLVFAVSLIRLEIDKETLAVFIPRGMYAGGLTPIGEIDLTDDEVVTALRVKALGQGGQEEPVLLPGLNYALGAYEEGASSDDEADGDMDADEPFGLTLEDAGADA